TTTSPPRPVRRLTVSAEPETRGSTDGSENTAMRMRLPPERSFVGLSGPAPRHGRLCYFAKAADARSLASTIQPGPSKFLAAPLRRDTAPDGPIPQRPRRKSAPRPTEEREDGLVLVYRIPNASKEISCFSAEEID
ncbi:hypothetical protein LGR54_25255, partial [Ancylobacter sp. Lp-2]|uniref:hypothetical protein n=1 Tax=Ancylobacter sp. Lp-2 TaxID=2881339 RepID=UPI001E2C0C71